MNPTTALAALLLATGCLTAAPIDAILARNLAVRTTPFKQTPCGQLPDGALLGNGDVGVVVAGTPAQLDCYVGKNDFWAPFDTYGYLRQDVPVSERRIGQLTYPLGGVSVACPALAQGTGRHELDLRLAESRSLLTAGALKLLVTARVAATANLLLLELDNQGAEPLALTVTTWTRPSNLLRVKPTANIPDTAAAGVAGDTAWVTRTSTTIPQDTWVTHGALATRVLGPPAAPAVADKLRVSQAVALAPGQHLVLATAVGNAVSFADDFPLTRIKELVTVGAEALTATQQAVARLTPESAVALTAAHRAWWADYWSRSTVELPDEPLLERFFYGAVYLMGASARPGKVPPGLFGAWVTVDRPSWSGDYHLDYNHEHPWYNVYAVNHTELAVPYCDSVVNLLPLARQTAARMHQAGALYRTCAGPYGWAHPGTHNMPNNAELAVNFRDYYDYTLDQDFLRNVAYPFWREVGRNWDDRLLKESLPGGGYRYKVRSAWDESGKLCDNPTSGLAFCRALYAALAQAAELLGDDAPVRAHYREVVDHLSTYAVTEYKGRSVFDFGEGVHNAEGNVYPYNTYPFYPAATEGPASPFRQVLVDTIATRPSLWAQPNSFTQVYAAAALGGYPADELLERLRTRLGQVLEPNGIVRTPGEMCLENALATNNVVLLLLQSTGGVLRLFPVWDLRKPARFDHLRAHGAFLVSARTDAGAVADVRLTSERGARATVRNPWPGQALVVTDEAGGAVGTTQQADDWSFATAAGHTYRLTPARRTP